MRRELKFLNFDEVRGELAELEKGPVETTALWSYAQILDHCRRALEGTMKGVQREMPWWMRRVVGPIRFRMMAFNGYFPKGVQSPFKGTATERIEGDEKAALELLRKTLEDFERFEGPLSIHFRLGPLTKEQWIHFHSMHIANHLGYAKTKGQF